MAGAVILLPLHVCTAETETNLIIIIIIIIITAIGLSPGGSGYFTFTCNSYIFRPSMPATGISINITGRSSRNVIAEDVRESRNKGDRLNNNVFVIHDCELCWPYYWTKLICICDS
jgi:hypothetical protein